MAKTRKIQVTLEESQYEQLAEIARREDKKLARVVRESIVRYCIEPAAAQRKREALDRLLALEPVPVPDDYHDWEASYGREKGGGGTVDAGDNGETGGTGETGDTGEAGING